MWIRVDFIGFGIQRRAQMVRQKHGRYSSMLHKPAVSFVMLAETKDRCKQYVGMFFPVDLMDRDEMGANICKAVGQVLDGHLP